MRKDLFLEMVGEDPFSFTTGGHWHLYETPAGEI